MNQPRILLVEDTPAKALLIEKAIRALWPRALIHLAQTSVDARQRLGSMLPFDAVITDHHLPMREGDEPSSVGGRLVTSKAFNRLGGSRVCVCSSDNPPAGWQTDFPGVLWINVDYIQEGLAEWAKEWSGVRRGGDLWANVALDDRAFVYNGLQAVLDMLGLDEKVLTRRDAVLAAMRTLAASAGDVEAPLVGKNWRRPR